MEHVPIHVFMWGAFAICVSLFSDLNKQQTVHLWTVAVPLLSGWSGIISMIVGAPGHPSTLPGFGTDATVTMIAIGFVTVITASMGAFMYYIMS